MVTVTTHDLQMLSKTADSAETRRYRLKGVQIRPFSRVCVPDYVGATRRTLSNKESLLDRRDIHVPRKMPTVNQ